jgi:hypothetical protein
MTPRRLLPAWWPTLAAIGNVLCAAGTITRWPPLLTTALAVQAVVLGTYAINRRRRRGGRP